MKAGEAIVYGVLARGAVSREVRWRGRCEDVPQNEEKAKIVLDVAKKRRNTEACFEVGYVSSSLPIGAAFSNSTPPRFTNHSRTLS